MSKNQYIVLSNDAKPVDLNDIPVLNYDDFSAQVIDLLNDPVRHCVAYYAVRHNDKLNFYCCIANDETSGIYVFSHVQKAENLVLLSLTARNYALHVFEREINENFGVQFENHPWMKPIRYSHDRYNPANVMDNYPFFKIDSDELHEVGVGPVHAGVIEPGHFRFICNGEKVLHLEIHLGYQHRGIEKLFIENQNGLQRSVLAESIAGDSAVAHGLAHAQLIESLLGINVSGDLQIERCMALELERIAVHIGDTAALCTDVAYQLGQVVCEALRTTIINTTQLWCGNRFGKGLIRPGGSHYPLDNQVIDAMLRTLDDSSMRFNEMTEKIFILPTVLSRFDGIGVVTQKQAELIGAVGMAARTAGIARDIRGSHPFQHFKNFKYEPITFQTGDLLARSALRSAEAEYSFGLIKEFVAKLSHTNTQPPKPVYQQKLRANSFAISLVEGWRGEICHTAITNQTGAIIHYKIKDPSFHNWMALALAVRNQEISDFPVCNKSFNLSYCGNDL